VPIDHPLFRGTQARLLVKAGRPLPAAALKLLEHILRDMPMFAQGGHRLLSAHGKSDGYG